MTRVSEAVEEDDSGRVLRMIKPVYCTVHVYCVHYLRGRGHDDRVGHTGHGLGLLGQFRQLVAHTCGELPQRGHGAGQTGGGARAERSEVSYCEVIR